MLRRGPPDEENKERGELLEKREKKKKENKGSGEVELVGGIVDRGEKYNKNKEEKKKRQREEKKGKIKREFIEEGEGSNTSNLGIKRKYREKNSRLQKAFRRIKVNQGKV